MAFTSVNNCVLSPKERTSMQLKTSIVTSVISHLSHAIRYLSGGNFIITVPDLLCIFINIPKKDVPTKKYIHRQIHKFLVGLKLRWKGSIHTVFIINLHRIRKKELLFPFRRHVANGSEQKITYNTAGTY